MTRIRQLAKVVRALRRPAWRWALITHGVLAATEHKNVLTGLAPTAVVDVGANRGQFALLCRELYPSIPIYALEPLAGACEVFRRLFRGGAGVHLFQVAAGDAAGRLPINVAARDDSSSLLPIGPGQVHAFPGTHSIGQQLVQVERLPDVLVGRDLGRAPLLKLDVQGNELPALRGCGEFLRTFPYVYVEVSFLELYAGQALAGDVIGHMTGVGFQLAGVENIVRMGDRRAVQADLLFARVGARFN